MNDHLGDVLKKKKIQGLDINIIISKPKEEEKTDSDLAPKPDAEDSSGPSHEDSQHDLMKQMMELHGHKMSENPFEQMVNEKDNISDEDNQEMQDHFTDMSDTDKQDLMGRKPRSIGERVRQAALKMKGK